MKNSFRTSIAFELGCKMPSGLTNEQMRDWIRNNEEMISYLVRKLWNSKAIERDPQSQTWKGRDS